MSLISFVTVVFAMGDKSLDKTFEMEDTTEKGVRHIMVYFKKHAFPFVNFFRKLKAMQKALALLNNIDIFHANIPFPVGIYASIINRKYRKPILYTEHWSGYFHLNKTLRHIFQIKVIRHLAANASFVVPVSQSLRDIMKKSGIKARYRIIGNAIDTRLFTPVEKKKSTFRLLHISTLNNIHKNIEGLLEVIASIAETRTDFIFQIVGDKNIEETRKLIHKIGFPEGIIDLQGTKTPEEIAGIMQQTDLYVAFSNYETFGVVYIEALACGVPVVTTETGILTEFDIADSYKIIPVKDKKQLKKHIHNYMDRRYPVNRKKMRKFVTDNFSYPAIAEKYSALYHQILHNDKSSKVTQSP